MARRGPPPKPGEQGEASPQARTAEEAGSGSAPPPSSYASVGQDDAGDAAARSPVLPEAQTEHATQPAQASRRALANATSEGDVIVGDRVQLVRDLVAAAHVKPCESGGRCDSLDLTTAASLAWLIIAIVFAMVAGNSAQKMGEKAHVETTSSVLLVNWPVSNTDKLVHHEGAQAAIRPVEKEPREADIDSGSDGEGEDEGAFDVHVVRQLFEQVDVDGIGKVAKHSFIEVLRDQAGVAEFFGLPRSARQEDLAERLELVLDAMNVNGDERDISWDEFLTTAFNVACDSKHSNDHDESLRGGHTVVAKLRRKHRHQG